MRLLMDDNYYKLYCSIHASMWEGILRTNIPEDNANMILDHLLSEPDAWKEKKISLGDATTLGALLARAGVTVGDLCSSLWDLMNDDEGDPEVPEELIAAVLAIGVDGEDYYGYIPGKGPVLKTSDQWLEYVSEPSF